MRPLLVFDFDGVLVDGMPEYWWSARRAALRLDPRLQLPEEIPPAFRTLRPMIHKGWEMVLVAADLGLPGNEIQGFLNAYDDHLQHSLERWGRSPAELQRFLEEIRSEAIARDQPAWLSLHRFYPGVVERLQRLPRENTDWVVLTTKGAAFATAILENAGLAPSALFGHEQGSKPEVLLRLSEQERNLLFLEDRRPTLERVRATPGLERVRCFLVSWGYLAPGDQDSLPAGIKRLDPETFQTSVASWP